MTDPLEILYESLSDVPEFTINGWGNKIWRNRAGEIHREDGPAVIYADGSEEWIRHNKRHREDGPATIRSNGTEVWYYNDKRHREDGPALTAKDGTEEWWINDKRHREGGPAMTYRDGTKAWYKEDKLYRDDGPAIEYPVGSMQYPAGAAMYVLDNNQLTKEEWLKDARVQRALRIKKLEDKEIKDDDFLRTFGDVL